MGNSCGVSVRVRGSEGGDYEVTEAARVTSRKFAGSAEKTFQNMLKFLEWHSFRRHDPNLIVDSCIAVQDNP